jgi:hypothetical protein
VLCRTSILTDFTLLCQSLSSAKQGYAILEYGLKAEAQNAIDEADGEELLGQKVAVGWAFVKGEKASRSAASLGRARRD